MNKDLWLFDYAKGQSYEEFSKCEDYNGEIFKYISNNYNFDNKIILEIGAGSGKFTNYLAKKCSKLYVVEKSPSLMQINKNKNDCFNIDYILDDIQNVEFPSKSIDVIFAGWSFTSMRDAFNILLPKFVNILKVHGKIILIENSGKDEFCKLMGIEKFTEDMKIIYKEMGFVEKTTLETVIQLKDKSVFYNVFPQYDKNLLRSLQIQHNVLVLESSKEKIKEKINYENN